MVLALSADPANYAATCRRRPMEEARTFPLIQHNPEHLCRVLLFDLDFPEAFAKWDEARLPQPTWCAVNPRNGHAHYGYQLEIPVNLSKDKQTSILRDTHVKFSTLLDADPSYSGQLGKNPEHHSWRVSWASERFDLLKLATWPNISKKRAQSSVACGTYLSRNVSIFDSLRQLAYREVLAYLKAKKPEADFRAWCRQQAGWINRDLYPLNLLPRQEIVSISSSVSRWCYKHFSTQAFSELQRKRIQARWSSQDTLASEKPWEKEGISRRHWFRLRSASPPALP